MKAKYILSTLGAGLFAMAPQSLLAQANLTWDTADANNTWNTVNSNWTGDAVFANGDNVTFTGAAGEVITVATGGVTAGSFTANHTAGTYAFSGASITGGALTKSGAGVLTFNQTNSFSSISVSAGPSANGTAGTAALVFTVSNALGSTPITLTNTAAMTAINTNAANLIVNNPIALTTANVQTNLLGLSATTQRYNGVISGGNASATLFLNMNTSGSDGVILFANTANTFTMSRITGSSHQSIISRHDKSQWGAALRW
jgi:autotransporter-associated beta strand protein